MGNAVYALALNQRRQRDGRQPNVLPIEDGNVLPDTDDDGIIGAIVHPPVPKAAARVESVRASRPERARGSRDPPPLCPPPTHEPVPVCGGGGEPVPGGEPAPPVEGDGGSDDEVIGAAEPSRPSGKRDRAVPPPTSCKGLTDDTDIVYQPYSTPTGKAYPNYTFYCAQCKPMHCARTRGDLPKFKSTSGEIEPIAFLHVWEQVQVPPGKKHNRVNPDPCDVTVFAETHRDELTALYNELHGRS